MALFTHICALHPLTDLSPAPGVDWGSFDERGQLLFLLCVIRVVCFSSRMLGPKFITLHSQKNSSFSVGNNFKMLFAEQLHPLSEGKNTMGTYAFTLQECHSIWFKWFVVSRLYLHCYSSFHIVQNIGQTCISLYPDFYIPFLSLT